MKATAVIPTHDERYNVQLFVSEILALPSLIGVIIVDYNSPDGTGNLVDALATAIPERVRAIHVPTLLDKSQEARLVVGSRYVRFFSPLTCSSFRPITDKL